MTPRPDPRRATGFRRRTALLLVALGLLCVVAVINSILPGQAGEPQRITIPAGDGFGQVTDTLVSRGIVRSRFWFKLIAKIRGLDRSVRAGIYEIAPGESPWQVLSLLQRGRIASVRFTVPEGLSLLETAALAERDLGVPRDSFLAAVRDPDEAARARLVVPTLEGFLLPETYQVPVGSSARDVVRIMAKAFAAAWKPAWDARLDTLGVTRQEIVTLASIIEGEARVDAERKIISGVYHNRLRIGMALQADPTVQYALEVKTGKPKPRLYQKDYDTPSPYNTYLHPGLPPGPIDSPGLSSLEAALYPADVPFFYFVARPDGHHVFSRTYDQHLRAVARARGERVEP